MLKLNLTNDQTSDFSAEIRPFERELYSAATISFHYGQSVFEGLKVFRQQDGSVAAFRADLHAERFVKSAVRMAMPPIPKEVFIQCLREFMAFEASSVPSEPEHSLYIRPLLMGVDEQVKVGRSKNYAFYILASIAGSYFHSGTKPARVMVNKQFVRAFPGGLGEIKTAANYAASLWPQTYAEKFQCDQVLYLDAHHHDYVDELGGMNFFAVRKGELITPELNGCILSGVTRRTILEVAGKLGLKAREEKLSFTQLLKGIDSGEVTESFACGTAAVVHSIGDFVVQDKMDGETREVRLPTTTPVAKTVADYIKKAQRGQVEAPSSWYLRPSQ